MDEPQAPSPEDMPPLKLMGHIHRSFHRLADPLLRERGFAMGQLPVLMALKDGRPHSQAELARLAQVEQPSMAQLLARMERDGLVERVPDPADGRRRLVLLTPACRKRMHESRAVMLALSAEVMAGFAPEELAELGRLLRRVADRVDGLLAERQG